MPLIIDQIRSAVSQTVRELYQLDVDPVVTPTADEKFGDYQSNLAMSLTRKLVTADAAKPNPRQLANAIAQAMGNVGGVASSVTVAGPGFINITLATAFLETRLAEAAQDDRLGVPLTATPQRVVVDYSGPNIAKELHIGHIRSTGIGDAAARVLEFQGHHVIRQNHLGDWGTQFGMLIHYLREVGYRDDTASTLAEIEDLEDFYREAKKRFDGDAAFQQEARQTVVRLQAGEHKEKVLWLAIIDETRRHFQPLYGRLNVLLTPEHEKGESSYNPLLAGTVAELVEKGIALKSNGATVVFADGPGRDPLIIQKTDGGFLYNTTDLAAVKYRVQDLQAQRVVYFVDARQSQHFRQIFATAALAGWTTGSSLEHAAFGTILGDDGTPMKTKTGGTVKLKDVLDEAEDRALAVVTEKNPDMPAEQRAHIAKVVGVGAVKYADLSKDRTTDYKFDWNAMLSFEGNTAVYLLFAYARTQGILRKAQELAVSGFALTVFKLETPQEFTLAKHILRLGEVIDLVGRELKPHYLTTYLYELASKFSAFFEHCPVLKSEEPTRSTRLALVALTGRMLSKGFDLLGIEYLDEM